MKTTITLEDTGAIIAEMEHIGYLPREADIIRINSTRYLVEGVEQRYDQQVTVNEGGNSFSWWVETLAITVSEVP